MGDPIFEDAIPIGNVFLDLENPRFEKVQTERAAIEVLCNDELVLPLAEDIALNGLNPLERFALIPDSAAMKGRKPTYVIAEGNRRMCAIKLLNDPDLAPSKYKAKFREIATNWTTVREISGVVFSGKDEAKIWLERIHQGEQDGKGRRRWNADQQERFAGGGRNKLAQAFLDYAERNRLISSNDRRGKLTTVQRYVSNADFRDSIGLDKEDSEAFRLTRPEDDFKILARRFIKDMIETKKVSSRKNKEDIVEYGRTIIKDENISGIRKEADASEQSAEERPKKPRRTTPTQPPSPSTLFHSRKIETGLRELGAQKLNALYHSITVIELKRHTPLVAIGVWSFIESLTAFVGRADQTNFVAFYSKTKLESLGYSGNPARRALQEALERIQDYGNNTKHHALAGTFDRDQLYNDMEVISELLERTVKQAVESKE